MVLTASTTIIVMCAIFQYLKDKKGLIDILVAFLTGGVFGVGLVLSGMNKRSKIMGFLTINEDWDRNAIYDLNFTKHLLDLSWQAQLA